MAKDIYGYDWNAGNLKGDIFEAVNLKNILF